MQLQRIATSWRHAAGVAACLSRLQWWRGRAPASSVAARPHAPQITQKLVTSPSMMRPASSHRSTCSEHHGTARKLVGPLPATGQPIHAYGARGWLGHSHGACTTAAQGRTSRLQVQAASAVLRTSAHPSGLCCSSAWRSCTQRVCFTCARLRGGPETTTCTAASSFVHPCARACVCVHAHKTIGKPCSPAQGRQRGARQTAAPAPGAPCTAGPHLRVHVGRCCKVEINALCVQRAVPVRTRCAAGPPGMAPWLAGLLGMRTNSIPLDTCRYGEQPVASDACASRVAKWGAAAALRHAALLTWPARCPSCCLCRCVNASRHAAFTGPTNARTASRTEAPCMCRGSGCTEHAEPQQQVLRCAVRCAVALSTGACKRPAPGSAPPMPARARSCRHPGRSDPARPCAAGQQTGRAVSQAPPRTAPPPAPHAPRQPLLVPVPVHRTALLINERGGVDAVAPCVRPQQLRRGGAGGAAGGRGEEGAHALLPWTASHEGWAAGTTLPPGAGVGCRGRRTRPAHV